MNYSNQIEKICLLLLYQGVVEYVVEDVVGVEVVVATKCNSVIHVKRCTIIHNAMLLIVELYLVLFVN